MNTTTSPKVHKDGTVTLDGVTVGSVEHVAGLMWRAALPDGTEVPNWEVRRKDAVQVLVDAHLAS